MEMVIKLTLTEVYVAEQTQVIKTRLLPQAAATSVDRVAGAITTQQAAENNMSTEVFATKFMKLTKLLILFLNS